MNEGGGDEGVPAALVRVSQASAAMSYGLDAPVERVMRVRNEVRSVSPVRLSAESSDRIPLNEPGFRLLQLLRKLQRRALRKTARVARCARAPLVRFNRKHLLLMPINPYRWPKEPSTPVRLCDPFPELRAGREQTACPSAKPKRRRWVGRELAG